MSSGRLWWIGLKSTNRVRSIILTIKMRYIMKSQLTTFISGLLAVMLLGYLSHNSVKTKIIKQKELVYQEPEIVTIIETKTDTLMKLLPVYLDFDELPFEDVFGHYRDKLGACDVFKWRDSIYTTLLDTESRDTCD